MIRSNPCERPLATRLIWQCGPGALLPQFRSRALATPVGWVSAIAGMERTKSRTTDKVRTKTRRIAYSFHWSPSVNTYLTGARFTMLTRVASTSKTKRLCVIRECPPWPSGDSDLATDPSGTARPATRARIPAPKKQPLALIPTLIRPPGVIGELWSKSHLDCPPFGPGRIGRIGWLWYPIGQGAPCWYIAGGGSLRIASRLDPSWLPGVFERLGIDPQMGIRGKVRAKMLSPASRR